MYSLVVNFDKEESSKWERTKIRVTMRTHIKYTLDISRTGIVLVDKTKV